MRLLVFENQPRVPINESKVRFIHLSPDTPPLDIAVKDRDVDFSKCFLQTGNRIFRVNTDDSKFGSKGG